MAKSPAQKLHEEGIKLFKKNKFEEARGKLETALDNAGSNQELTAQIYNDLGVVYRQLDDLVAGHAALDEAMTLFTELDDPQGQATILGNRAALFEAAGDNEQAVEFYKQSAKMMEDLGENDLAMHAWQAVSRLRMKEKKYIAAIGAYEEGIDNLPEDSLKRKFLQGLMRMPGNMLAGQLNANPLPHAADDEDDEDDDDPAKK